MSLDLTVSLWTILRLLVVAALALLVLRGGRITIQVAPMLPHQRRSFTQAWPLVELLVAAAYLMWAVQQLVRGEPLLSALAVLGVAFGALWLVRYALMDTVTGVMLRTSGSVAVGDRVSLDGVEGRVQWLGYRVLAIETRGGDEALVPYSRISRQAVLRTPATHGAYRHTFQVSATSADVAEQVRRLALLCHWSSAARPPVIDAHEGGLEVTVFALEPERGPQIEAFVRRGLGA